MPRTSCADSVSANAQGIIFDTNHRLLILIIAAVYGLAQTPLEQAAALAREKRYADARKSLEGAAEPVALPQRIAFHRVKAAIASGLGDAALAANEMHTALALAPDDPPLQVATAAAELQAGLLDDALRHVQAGANTAAGQALLGDIQEKRGEYVEAVKAYQTAVALAPDREQYRVALALELVQHYTFEPAIAVLEQAAPLFPRSGRIRTLLGIAQYAAGRLEDAESAFTDAIAQQPDIEPVYEYLALVALESPSPPADRMLQSICSHQAIACAALQSRAAIANGDSAGEARAVAELKRAPKDSAVARCELGRIYQAEGQWADARAHLEACVQLSPLPQHHYRLALVYSRLGLTDQAQVQMDLRKKAEAQKAEELARRQSAVATFKYFMK
jgi:tetratricopeptide (TPR) repeat protein